METIYERGALWRRWDLHIHSPASIKQDFGGEAAWPRYIEELAKLPSDVKVVGITDYYFLDGYRRVMAEKMQNGRLDNLEKVFPIIEFRIDTFASASQSKLQKVNLHVLFDIDENNLTAELQAIEDEFIRQMHISKHHRTTPLTKENLIAYSSNKNLQSGLAELVPSTDELFTLLHSERWRKKLIVFAGYPEWHNLDKGQQVKPTKSILYASVDAFLSASEKDALAKKSEVLQDFGGKIFLHSLDIHSFEQFEAYKCLTWIKADPTFKGLKHALLNPKERTFIGYTPPRLEYEQDNPQCFIDSVTINSRSVGEGWFDDVPPIYLNSGLVAIIGDKGNGKSALADIVALGANNSRPHYSFLHKEQFHQSRDHKKYTVELRFHDGGTPTTCSFSEPTHNAARPERVTYLSQSFVNQLCGEVAAPEALQSEIDRVIFAHLPTAKKLKLESLPKLVMHRGGSYEARLAELRDELAVVNVRIVELEDCTDELYRIQLEALVAQQREALRIHEATKPVPPPQSGRVNVSVALVAKYVAKKAELDELAESHRSVIAREEFEVDHLLRSKERITELGQRVADLVNELARDEVFISNTIDVKSLVAIDIKTDEIDVVCERKSTIIDSGNNYIDRLSGVIDRIGEFIERQRMGQTDAERRQNDYVVETQKWERRKKELLGLTTKRDSLQWNEDELERTKREYPEELLAQYEDRKELAQRIVDTIFEKEHAIKDIYSHAQRKAEQYAAELEIPIEEFIEFTARVALSEGFQEKFFAFVDHNRSGTFYRTERAETQLKLLLPTQRELDKGSLLTIPNNILSGLTHNLQNDPRREDIDQHRKLKDQLLGDKVKTKRRLYDFLFSFEYVKPRFSITYSGKEISKLSPGERGILLLAFYLLIDDNPNPIIVDQPEENIGNLTIARRLVEFIRLAKRRRQIIVVTHSANLAIVCDADQILHCQMDKVHNNTITYTSGSIEYDDIKIRSIDILEGTRASFDSRKEVWQLLDENKG